MRKTILYIAASLNGKIAKADGSVGWLESIPNPDKLDYGYYGFYKSIDTTIQGYKTYTQVLSWGVDFPYSDKKNYVFTRKKGLVDTQDVAFVSENHIEFLKQLKSENGKGIWIVGGGMLNTKLLDANLIDEIQLFVMPIVLDNGIDLFDSLFNETKLSLLKSKSYSNGVVELRYSIDNTVL